MKIPWKKLTKDPLVVMVDDVYVVVEPDLDATYDPEKDLKRQRKAKEKKIKEYEEAAKKRKLKESECARSLTHLSRAAVSLVCVIISSFFSRVLHQQMIRLIGS